MKTNNPMKKAAPVAAVMAAVCGGLCGRAEGNPERLGRAERGEFAVHEWGTFTSVSGSDGRLLPGVEREEEELPPFVYSHEGMGPAGNSQILAKGWRRPLANVTARMETPVLYFYTEKPLQVEVEVCFHGGSISQWYPQRSGGEVPPPLEKVEGNPVALRPLDFAGGYEGSIRWKVDVIPAGEDAMGRVFKFGEAASWLHPRQTDSALVRTADGETEKYLFYRGLGRIDPPVSFLAKEDGTLHIRNGGGTATGEMMVFSHTPSGVSWRLVSPTDSGGETTVSLSGPLTGEDWRRDVYEAGAQMLVRAGLFRPEADAMMQTWWSSYFERQGTRVFWIAPSPVTDSILPLTIHPAPDRIARVMVGRTEILTPQFEAQLVRAFDEATPENPNPFFGDRFYPAYETRVRQIRQLSAN